MEICLLSLVLALLMLGGSLARVVTVSPGPLIRVEGQPVSIRCDVNEYGGPREQDFEWMMSRDASAQRIKIISTFDASYSHASLSKRVASGDISVVRLQDNEVELKIAEVKALDAGFYWCTTPSTDSVISGNYEAQVQLTVIPNTLKVSPQTPPPVVPEGSEFTLSCNVTRELIHPTYLSVTWTVKRGATSEEILTFGPQGDVTPGPKFAWRYADGGIRLVPGKNGVFELVISRVTSSDDGSYECNGTEWTHESGGRWIKIVESTREMGTVAVTPTDPQDSCDKYGATNGNVAVPLNHKLQPSETLRWKHGDTNIFKRNRDGTITLGKKEDIDENGSLNLMNLDKSKAGTYKPEVYGNDGTPKGDLKGIRLCILDPVTKPQVTFKCALPSVKFTCNVAQTKDVTFEWLQNEKLLEKVKLQTLPTKQAKDVVADTFSCRVSNPVSSMTSAPVKHNCFTSGFVLQEKELWMIVCGGGGVVLLLIILTVCIPNRLKKRMQLKDEEELRLGWANPNQQQQQQQPPPHPPQHHNHPHHQHQQPAGHTGPRPHRSKHSHGQPRPRDPNPPSGQPLPSPRRAPESKRPAVVDDEQPPPLPQPRKKAPKTPRV